MVFQGGQRTTATALSDDIPSTVPRIVTQEELARHKSKRDAWVVVDGNVYNVASFLESHPGGEEIILEHLHEKDIGELMRGETGEEGEHHLHSKVAFRMLQQYLVGPLSRTVDATHPVMDDSDVANKPKSKKFTVDLTKPIVAQVGYLGEDYDEWVHDPIVCKETPRFFESDITEYFTRTKWWVIPMVWCPVSFGMFHIALQNGMTMQRLPYMLFVGVLFWTFLEYVLHRFLFHMKTTSFWANTFHYVLHGFHHKHPMDGSRLVMPPAMAAPIVVAIWVLMGDWVAVYPDKLVLYGGTILAYVCYDLTHYFLHFGTPFNLQLRQLKRYHMIHHFKDHSNGYGITSRFWDWIFSTVPAAALSKLLQ
ncbi:unnamed protein product [Calypogeia fissa]